MSLILVIEDNPQNLKLTTIILKSAGHDVIGARSSTEAEAALSTSRPHLILMDIALPGKDGYTLTRELRRRPETALLPILAVSSFAMTGDAERALAAGCTSYLTKPIRRATLLQRVSELLAPPAAGGPPLAGNSGEVTVPSGTPAGRTEGSVTPAGSESSETAPTVDPSTPREAPPSGPTTSEGRP